MPRSTFSTARHTRTPAIRPMIKELRGVTNPHGAVIATKPASRPLPLIEASGLPYRIHMYSMAEIPPAIPASIVFTATDPIRSAPLPDAPRVDPGLNPNHP